MCFCLLKEVAVLGFCVPLAVGHPFTQMAPSGCSPQSTDGASARRVPTLIPAPAGRLWAAVGRSLGFYGLQVPIVIRKLLWKCKDPFNVHFLGKSSIAKWLRAGDLHFESATGRLSQALLPGL